MGRFPNPITDINWAAVFPIYLMGIKIVPSKYADEKSHPSAPCFCQKGPVIMPGIPVSLWEPARMVDVTRTPWCLVNMGGIQAGTTGSKGRGDIHQGNPHTSHSFYNVHWYTWPFIYWFEIFLDFICLEKRSVELAYVTELDPLWNDDSKSMIINPDAILFGNPIAQAACIWDCAQSTFGLPSDKLYWCGGCNGSLFPYTGTVPAHEGGVQASQLLVDRMIAKLHRELLLPQTKGKRALCRPCLAPIIVKSQYRTQMLYPIPQTRGAQSLGASAASWQAGREYPVKGSDFGYLIWRKRDCCMF